MSDENDEVKQKAESITTRSGGIEIFPTLAEGWRSVTDLKILTFKRLVFSFFVSLIFQIISIVISFLLSSDGNRNITVIVLSMLSIFVFINSILIMVPVSIASVRKAINLPLDMRVVKNECRNVRQQLWIMSFLYLVSLILVCGLWALVSKPVVISVASAPTVLGALLLLGGFLIGFLFVQSIFSLSFQLIVLRKFDVLKAFTKGVSAAIKNFPAIFATYFLMMVFGVISFAVICMIIRVMIYLMAHLAILEIVPLVMIYVCINLILLLFIYLITWYYAVGGVIFRTVFGLAISEKIIETKPRNSLIDNIIVISSLNIGLVLIFLLLTFFGVFSFLGGITGYFHGGPRYSASYSYSSMATSVAPPVQSNLTNLNASVASATSVESSASRYPITSLKFGATQVADVSRQPAYPIAGAEFSVAGFQSPLDSNLVHYSMAPGEYIQLFFVGGKCHDGMVGINLYNDKGELIRTLQPSGRIYGLSPKGFLFTTMKDFATFFSLEPITTQRISYISAAGPENETCAALESYQPPATQVTPQSSTQAPPAMPSQPVVAPNPTPAEAPNPAPPVVAPTPAPVAAVSASPSASNTLKKGDFYQGGVIYWLDPKQSFQHGIVADIADAGDMTTDYQWSSADTTTSATQDGAYIGKINTAKILATPGATYPAASACATSKRQGYSDWYLPSKTELVEIYKQKMIIDATALKNGGGTLSQTNYWNSTEADTHNAGSFLFNHGLSLPSLKHNSFGVRCVRAF